MNLITRTDYQKPFILLFVAIGIAISALSLGLFFYHEKQLEDNINFQAAQSEFAIKKERFDINFNRFDFLLHSVANNTDFLAYVDYPDDTQKYFLASKIFNAVTDSHPSIMQLRYLDANGKEKIRIERTALHSKANEVSQDMLQDKSDRYYFIDTVSKKEGELFVSKLDLNIEHGKIETPIKPVLRIALPVYRHHESKGVIIVNLFMSEVYKSLTSSSSFYIYLYDQDNHLLTSNDPTANTWEKYLSDSGTVNSAKFIYSNNIVSTNYETISLGLKPKQEAILLSMTDKNIYLMLFGLIIPIGFVLAYFLSKIPKRLFDALEQRESIMIQQSKMAAMGEMIGAIAHQWRQPLNAIGVLAQEIEVRHEYGNLEKQDLKSIVNELLNYLEYMSATIDDFRNFFNPAKEKSVFDLLQAINESIEIIRTQIDAHSISVKVEKSCDAYLSACAFEVDGYENEFKQVIINLINNAKEAIVSHRIQQLHDHVGRIHIFIQRAGKNIVIRIQDNGGGIQKSVMERIFDPYISTKYEQHGTGIGLYLAKLIIERNMHGTINASNIQNGAEFKIILPAAKQ